MRIKEDLHSGRIVSIDALRGITIFAMIFVNELAGVRDVPAWMKHVPAEADAMTFVDIVFPAFLFIVGMSIPFSFNARLRKGENDVMVWKHTLKRTFALLVMGLFMVNAESGYDEDQMLIPKPYWGFLAYSVPILVWNKYSGNISAIRKNVLQIGGMAIFVAMYFLYVRTDGGVGMTVQWWGILGLIGWAYFYTVLVYWFGKGKLQVMLGFLAFCVAINIMNSAGITSGWFGGNWRYFGSHFSHTSIVVSGVLVSLLYFDRKGKTGISWEYIVFVIALFAVGFALRPYFEVSKIRATPSWCLYSAGICAVLYSLLHWLMEQRKQVKWSNFFMPAANNPLLIYILPGIVAYMCAILDVTYRPEFVSAGLPGIIWSLAFSILMLYLVKLFNRMHIQLHL